MLSTDDVIDRIVGKAFEMDCPDIEVFGIRDSASPLYKGPGVIVGEQRGPISFRLHNQIKMSPEALDSMRPIEHGTLGEPVSPGTRLREGLFGNQLDRRLGDS